MGDERVEFAQNLDVAMYRAKISQAELSRLTGIDKSCISRYLSGECAPDLWNLKKILSALRITFEELMYGC